MTAVPEGSKTVIEVADANGTSRQLTLTNLDKVLYPEVGFTKAAIVDYYARIAPVMLPHLRRRIVTMVRYPNGVDEASFFEKRCPPHAPTWVATAELDGLEGCVVDDLPTLVWMANLAALELHTHQATVDDPEHPTAIVFDLDPGPPAGILDCCRVALDLKEMLVGSRTADPGQDIGFEGTAPRRPDPRGDGRRDEGLRAARSVSSWRRRTPTA